IDADAALANLHRRMREPAGPRLVVERGGGRLPLKRKMSIVPVTALAAAVAAAVTIVVIRDRTQPGASPTPPHAAARTYETAVGKRDSINLPDGSRVILGPDSRIVVLGDYGTRARAIELQGDAYFDVRHDPAKPFSVQVGRALIEDIGTTFAVESDAGDTTTVAVITGSVRLLPSGTPSAAGEVLSAGDRGSLSDDGKLHAYPHTVSDDTSWTSGHLIFKDASVPRLVGEIHRWFGVDIQVSDTALLSKHVSTSFDSGDPVDQVLKVLGLALGASVERHGDHATLSFAHGPAAVR
ncbi:MAG TPA: FecR domain-containing protein, partial [Gemmatimonadaceae bacterium]|nr:FecR domain-containing protein [Gemmatimonadaceae bacterium]